MFLTDKGVSRSWNVFLWVALFTGTGLLMCLYSMEWYARINCPVNTVSSNISLRFLKYIQFTQIIEEHEKCKKSYTKKVLIKDDLGYMSNPGKKCRDSFIFAIPFYHVGGLE